MLKTKFKNLNLLVMALFMVLANVLFVATPASAATMPNAYIRLNRMAAGQTTSVRVVFKTVAAGATTASVAFNGADSTTWTGTSGIVNTTQTISSASCAADTGATALPGTLAATGATGTVSITGITSLSATTLYCFDLTSSSAVTNATAGEYHPVITAGADSTTVAVRTISADQISITAAVPPTFNLALGATTDTSLSGANALAPGSVRVSTGTTVTVNTNAKNGWFAWASDSNTGLTSPTSGVTIPSVTPGTTATLSAGTAGYLFGITSITQGSGGGVTSAATAYSSNGTTTGSGLDTTIRQIASSTGTANGAVLNIKNLVAISPTTQPATDYADTITIIGAGYF